MNWPWQKKPKFEGFTTILIPKGDINVNKLFEILAALNGVEKAVFAQGTPLFTTGLGGEINAIVLIGSELASVFASSFQAFKNKHNPAPVEAPKA